MDKTKEYRVFISYSWTTPDHEKWVYDLAIRLMENGIDVKLDKWDLRPGQDKYAFMETMVQDETIDRVLIICDQGFKDKADSRAGGVGTETQIITPEIYGKVNQEKFVPIIKERGEGFDSYMPTYLKSRIAVDMSSDENYENGYEQLLRLITERPLFRKPAKGQLPTFLFEDEKPHFRTQNLVKQLKHSLLNKPEQATYIVSDFFEEFNMTLEQFKLVSLNEPYDEEIFNKLIDMLSLRNDYIDFLTSICKGKISSDIMGNLIHLFEDIYTYTEFQGTGTFNQLQFDHFKFFITELFLYTVIILIENDQYENLNVLLSSKFFTKSRYGNGIVFTDFRFYIQSLDEYRNSRLSLRKVSVTADILVQRSIRENKSYKEKLLDADLLLHYISVIKACGDWFPTTHVYRDRDYNNLDILRRLESKRHFDKIKILFNVNTKEEMASTIQSFKNPYRGYSSSFEKIPHIGNYIKLENICAFS